MLARAVGGPDSGGDDGDEHWRIGQIRLPAVPPASVCCAKLAECQYGMEVLGDLPLRVAYEWLAGMVRMLGEDVRAMALRNAYAIDMPAPDTLTRRRERIAGIRGLSIDTIELYERNMIDELALRLAHGELPVGS
jgi:hypothetical protein